MVSRRYRANRSVGNKLVNLQDKVIQQQKSGKANSIASQAITDDNIADGTIQTNSLGDSSVNSKKLARGAVTTANLGVVNQINSDANLLLNVGDRGHVIVEGEVYESPYEGLTDATGLNTIAFDPTDNSLKILDARPPATDGLRFDTSYTGGSTAPGMLSWNSTEGTLEFQMMDSGATQQIGMEQLLYVRNNTGSTLNNGSAVYFSGSSGTNFYVSLAKANAESTSAQTMGILTETLNTTNHKNGYVTTFGVVHDIDISYIPTATGVALADGQALYLDPTTAGHLTNVKPVAPNHLVYMGFILSANGNGAHADVFAKPQNGYEIGELHDVKINTNTLDNGHVITYNLSTGVWENQASTSGTSVATVKYTPGFYYHVAQPTTVYGSSSTKNTGYLSVIPWRVESTITVDSLSVNVAGGGNNNLRLAVYDSTGGVNEDLPGVAVINPTTALSLSTAGVKSYTGLATTLTPGRYWVAYQYSSTTAVNIYEFSSAILIAGHSTPFGTGGGGYKTAYSYGTFPSDLSVVDSSGWSYITQLPPQIMFGVI